MSSTPTSRPELNMAQLDLTDTSCPMAFVKARIFLDQCTAEKIVEILYQNTPANEPLARSIQTLGHLILPLSNDQWTNMSTANEPQKLEHSHANTLQLKRIIIQVKK